MKKKVVITNGKKLAYPPKDEKEQNKLADLMVTWSYSEPALEITDFPLSYGFTPYRFFKIADSNEYFEEALQLAKSNIGSRLLRKLRDEELDKDYVFRLLPMYNKEYKEFVLAKVKVDVQTRLGISVVEIPKIPDCVEVPNRN